MFQRYGSLLGLLIAGVSMQAAFVNCGKPFQEYKLDDATSQVLGAGAFASTAVDLPLGDVATNADGVTEVRRMGGTIDTEIPVVVPTPTPGPTPAPQCVERAPMYEMMVARIKAMDAGDYQLNAKLEGKHLCEVALKKFSAAGVDKDGKLIKGRQIADGTTAVNMYCHLPQDRFMQLNAKNFKGKGLRGGQITKTHICRAGTEPKDCTPSHANYLFGIEYGTYGTKMRVDTSDKYAAMEIISRVRFSDTQALETQECHDVSLYSPLVIEKKFGAGIRTLDPRAQRTLFDITGTGRKDRISCVTGGAFLALPDAAGEISSVHQLFGDQTVGPDGRKAANGFAALGKWDSKPVGKGYGAITPADAIFQKLRLWEDRNCDGIADQSEIEGLEAYEIRAIRWIDHVEMRDIDAYGNATLQRNVAYTKDGHLRVFDLWFMLGN